VNRFAQAASLALLLFKGSAGAQVRCVASTEVQMVRAEGTAELLGDIVLRCAGAAPAQSYEVLLSMNTTFANRTLPSGSRQAMSWTDALLLVDEPGAFSQVPCVPAGSGACAGANIFQARQLQDNLLVFQDVPIAASANDGTRVLRIANLRANVAALRATDAGAPVRISLQLFSNGRAVSLQGADLTLAVAQPALLFSIRTASDGSVAETSPALSTTPSSLPDYSPVGAPAFNVKFREGSAKAFRRRNAGTSGGDPLFVAPQAMPGWLYSTESGFYNPDVKSTNGIDSAGLADSGTRLRVVFKDVPRNVALWASIRDVKPGTSRYSAVDARAILTDSDPKGVGVFSPTATRIPGFAPIGVSADGYATAVWEVVSSDPDAVEEISFAIAVSSKDGPAALGTATVFGSLAPNFENPYSADSAASAPLPRFTGTSAPVVAFGVAAASESPRLTVVSGASYKSVLAPAAIATAFGASLSISTEAARGELSTSLAGTSVNVIDSAGNRSSAVLFAVSPGQINFLLDPATRTGPAVVNVVRGDKVIAFGTTTVDRVAPALFSADGRGSGPALGEVLQLGSNESSFSLGAWDPEKREWVGFPIDLGREGDLVYLILYGTGIRGRGGLSEVSVEIGGNPVPVIFAGPQNTYPGLDQVNVGPLPRSLQGLGATAIVVKIAGKDSNRLTILIK
jgi:uncharacterized protein (TIGR03437 family)